MKIVKPTPSSILIVDEQLTKFNLEVQSKTGLNDSEFNDEYEALILAFRLPDMDASKQIFYGDYRSLITLFSSSMENLLRNKIITEELLDEMVKLVKQQVKELP